MINTIDSDEGESSGAPSRYRTQQQQQQQSPILVQPDEVEIRSPSSPSSPPSPPTGRENRGFSTSPSMANTLHSQAANTLNGNGERNSPVERNLEQRNVNEMEYESEIEEQEERKF